MKYSWKYSIAFDGIMNMNGTTDADGTSYFVFVENGDILCSDRRPT